MKYKNTHESKCVFFLTHLLYRPSGIIRLTKKVNLILKQEVDEMKGYYVQNGYMGCVDGSYMLFADESDYIEYFED